MRIESIVPPLIPPRSLVTTSVVPVSAPAPSAAAWVYSRCTPRSEGIESKPHECTIRAPVERAGSWFSAMLSRTKSTSPVTST